MKAIGILLLTFLVSCSSIQQVRGPSSRKAQTCYQELATLLLPRRVYTTPFNRELLVRAENLDDVRAAYGNTSMFDIKYQGMGNNRAAIEANNSRLQTLLTDEVPPIERELRAGEVSTLREGEIQGLYRDLLQSPCVRDHYRYRRPEISVGYCFGRATIGHFLGAKKGLNAESMKKIWVVGDMDHWGHHVAVMVRGEDRNWYVLDNVTGLVTHQEWIRKIKQNYETTDPLMFYVTDASRFGPRINATYSPITLFNLPYRIDRRNMDGIRHLFDGEDYDQAADYYMGFFRDGFEYIDDIQGTFLQGRLESVAPSRTAPRPSEAVRQ